MNPQRIRFSFMVPSIGIFAAATASSLQSFWHLIVWRLYEDWSSCMILVRCLYEDCMKIDLLVCMILVWRLYEDWSSCMYDSCLKIVWRLIFLYVWFLFEDCRKIVEGVIFLYENWSSWSLASILWIMAHDSPTRRRRTQQQQQQQQQQQRFDCS